VRGNIWIGVIVLLAVALVAVWLFAAEVGGPYFSVTTNDTKLKAYPVVSYFPADGKTRTVAVTLQVQNLGNDDATYLVKPSDQNTNETLDVAAGKTEKMVVRFDNISADAPKLVTKDIAVSRNSSDNNVADVPVYIVIGTAPKVTEKTDKNDTVVGQKFIIADSQSDSFIIYADVNDDATVQDINVTAPDTAPITVTRVTYAETTLNSNKYQKIVVNYHVKDSALKNKLYDLNYTVSIGYDGNTVETVTMPAVFVYGGPQTLADEYDSVFSTIENVG